MNLLKYSSSLKVVMLASMFNTLITALFLESETAIKNKKTNKTGGSKYNSSSTRF